MGGFPALPSPWNSAVNSAEGFASGAAHIYNQAQEAKRQAATQKRLQQQQQAAQDQTAFMNQLRLHNAGAMPAEVTQSVMTDPKLETAGSGMFGVPIISNAEAPRDTGLKKRTANPAIPAGAQGQYVRDPASGQTAYLPTPGEKQQATLNDSNSFVAPPGSKLESDLRTFGVQPGTRITDAHMNQFRGLQKDLDAESDKAKKGQQVGTVTQPLSDDLAKHGWNVPVGTQVPFGNMATVSGITKPTPTPKKTLHWERSTDDKGAVHVRAYDEDGLLASEHTYPGEGKATKQPAATGADKPPTKSLLTSIESRKGTALKKARDAYRKAVTSSIPGVPVDDDAKRQAGADLKQAYQDAQNDYEAQLSAATGHDIDHDEWADNLGADAGETPAAPAAETPGAPAQPAAAAPQAAVPAQTPAAPAQRGGGKKNDPLGIR
jgi:hypothetical protein